MPITRYVCWQNKSDKRIRSNFERIADDLLKQISYERVEKSNSRSQAEYNAETGLVVVTRKLGKWNTIGYRMNNLDCLKYYEALHLIDTVG